MGAHAGLLDEKDGERRKREERESGEKDAARPEQIGGPAAKHQ
jgi:hypothetical protein